MASKQVREEARSVMPTVAEVAEQQMRDAQAEGKVDRKITVVFRESEYVVSRRSMEDVETLELLEDEKYITLIRRIVGKEQWTRFKDQVREEDGVVPASSLEEFITAVMAELDPSAAS